jgi:hypothetical protein
LTVARKAPALQCCSISLALKCGRLKVPFQPCLTADHFWMETNG